MAESYVKEFLDFLTFVTNARFRLHKILHVFEWSRDQQEQNGIYYAGFANHDVPVPALDQQLLETVALIQNGDTPPSLRRALKWFGNGVAARYPDDQFTYFWFSIELLAEISKNSALVPDRCSKCRGPLYCEACGTSHLHRPYPKQAIAQLFGRYIKGEWEPFYQLASEARNRLMHGDEVAQIEASLSVTMSDLVNNLGSVASTTLLHQFQPALVGRPISLLTTNQYVHTSMLMGARLTMALKADFDIPHPDFFPKVGLSLVHPDGTELPRS